VPEQFTLPPFKRRLEWPRKKPAKRRLDLLRPLAEFATLSDHIEQADTAHDNDACVLHNTFRVRDADDRQQ
jgi:hypothetical protein